MRTLLTFSVLLCVLTGTAQTVAPSTPSPQYANFVGGSFFAEGGTGYSQVNFRPYYGHFLKPNLALEVGAGYRFYQFNPQLSNAFKESNHEVSASLGLRTYIGSEAPLRFFLLNRVAYAYGFASTQNPNLSNEDANTSGTRSIGLSVAPVVSYTVKRFNLLAFFGSAGFAHIPKQDILGGRGAKTEASNDFLVSLSSSFGLGAEYRF